MEPAAAPAGLVCEALETDPASGLPRQAALERLDRFGPNALPEPKEPLAITRLLKQFRNGMAYLLAGAAVVATLVGDALDGAVILVIVLVNAVLGAWQEGRAASAAKAVRQQLSPTARALRSGQLTELDATVLVPGDVISLAAGDRVPADARLLAVQRLEVDESLLTGESLPATKRAEPPVAPREPLASQATMVFAGTTVTRGRARAAVTATAVGTQLGRIAELGTGQPERKTPLQQRLDRLAGTLLRGAVAACVALAALAWLHGEPFGKSLLVGVSLAVAAVPEGLVAVVTVALALGMRRLAEQGAIVRRLSAVETLGSTTVICTDKTGTLTENRMRVAGLLPLAATAGDGEGSLLEAALLASELGGDPIEAAIAEAAAARGLSRARLVAGGDVVGGEAFDAQRKRMSFVLERDGQRVSYVKGAPEALLPRLSDQRQVGEIERATEAWAADGIRVLLVATRTGLADGDDPESELVPTGLVGLADPPRAGTRRSVELARRAGVRTLMITGDHPATALAIARRCGVVRGAEARAITGPELDRLGDDELLDRVAEVDVFARAVPEHKLRLIAALQAQEEVVAMTGDGVNDVPGLARADIGVAMGRGGSDAAAQAADIVLTDNDYSTIVAAIERGRGIYQNILRFTQFLLAANAGEILVFTLAIVPGYPPPLTVVQILLVNLLTDGLPALALAVDPPERDLMRRPPRPPRQRLLDPIRGRIALGGALTGLAAFASFVYGNATSAELGQTMAFTTLVFAQLAYVFAIRGDAPFYRAGRNGLLLAAVALSALVAASVLAIPSLAARFDAVPMSGPQLAVAAGLASLPFLGTEVAKAFLRRRAAPADESSIDP